ncbi:MAG TPA: helix-turn-helix domain-containing protein [Chloroflexi bacterium]|nr:helix-turn-helix domain-containing protein [Chloroflexota bacterium]
MSTQEAAQILGVTQRTVQTAIKRGQIKAKRVGRFWAVEKDSLSGYTYNKGGKPTHKKHKSEVD